MTTQPAAVCEWKHCDAPASKHVWFGLPVRDAAGREPIGDLPYTTEDKDLCRKHAADVGRQYIHVTEFELE
jgi:hypothetical protein